MNRILYRIANIKIIDHMKDINKINIKVGEIVQTSQNFLQNAHKAFCYTRNLY